VLAWIVFEFGVVLSRTKANEPRSCRAMADSDKVSDISSIISSYLPEFGLVLRKSEPGRLDLRGLLAPPRGLTLMRIVQRY
jgi:hypothetical protein